MSEDSTMSPLRQDRRTFGNDRWRLANTTRADASMRNILKKRIANQFANLNDNTKKRFVKWLWPYHTSQTMGDYNVDPRWIIRRKSMHPGLPRWAINHYLKKNCDDGAITTMTPPIKLRKKFGVIESAEFLPGTATRPKIISPHTVRHPQAHQISSLPEQHRKRVCNSIKSKFVNLNNRGNPRMGWTEMHTSEKLKNYYKKFEGTKRIQNHVRSEYVPQFQFGIFPSHDSINPLVDVIFQFSMLHSNSPPIRFVQMSLQKTARQKRNEIWIDLLAIMDSYKIPETTKYKKYIHTDIGGVSGNILHMQADLPKTKEEEKALRLQVNLTRDEKLQLKMMRDFIKREQQFTPEGWLAYRAAFEIAKKFNPFLRSQRLSPDALLQLGIGYLPYQEQSTPVQLTNAEINEISELFKNVNKGKNKET